MSRERYVIADNIDWSTQRYGAATSAIQSLSGINRTNAREVYEMFRRSERITSFQSALGMSKAQLEEQNPTLQIVGGQHGGDFGVVDE